MRVITGTARGRKRREPAGMEIRPTTDTVKEAVFSMIQFDIEGRRVLDLFAGTGQLGIECLSRGAASVTFVDESRDAVKLIRENLDRCGMHADVVQAESIGFIGRDGRYDLIFLDPPYDTGLLQSALEKIVKFDILSDGGIIICESRQETVVPALPTPYFVEKERRYGKIKITLCGKREMES